MKMNNQSGFSLIELMVVVAVIGILSTVAGPNYYQTVKIKIERSQILVLKKHLLGLRVQDDGNNGLTALTGLGCSSCTAGITSGDLRGWVPPPSYVLAWNRLGYDTPPKDTWGNHYMINENEMDLGISDCRLDTVWSAGPDGIWAGFGDGDDLAGDDLVIRLPHSSKPCPAEDPITGGM